MTNHIKPLNFSKKNWGITAAILLLCPMLANYAINATTRFGESNLWSIVMLVVLINTGRKIGNKQHGGWLWLSGFFYAESWTKPGVTAWLYLILAGWAIYTAIKWAKNTTAVTGEI